DEAIVLAPEMVEAYRCRADVHNNLGDDDKALADYSRAIELDPYEPTTIRKRAALYLKNREPKRAVADFERLIDLQPENALSYRGLARAWLAQGDEAKATPALVAALRWAPALRKAVLQDILEHGGELRRNWPDDPDKRAAWYTQALEALRPAILNEDL